MTSLGNLGLVLIALNEDFQRMRFQKIQDTLKLKEILTNAGVGYLKVEGSIMISLKTTRSLTSSRIRTDWLSPPCTIIF